MRTILILLLFSASAFADFASFAKPNGDTEIKPQAIPANVLTTVVTGDVHLTNLFIMVSTGTPTVTVQDMQGTPIPILPGIVTTNGTVYFLPPGSFYWAVGGIKVNSTAVGAYIYASWR